MSDEGHRLKIERFFECFNRRDFDGMREVVHEDFVQEWPQSRERIRGLANQRAVLRTTPDFQTLMSRRSTAARTVGLRPRATHCCG